MLDKLCSLDGRADRREFWMVHIPTLALQLGSVGYFLMRSLSEAYGSEVQLSDLRLERLLLAFADHRSQLLPFVLIPMLPQAAVAMRRMNDRGRPGWWVVFLLTPLLFTLLIGDPHIPRLTPTYLTATTLVLLVWYFIDLGIIPGHLGSIARAEKSHAWMTSMFESLFAEEPAAATAGRTENISVKTAAEAAVDRAIAERRESDRRGTDRRVGMADTRQVKVERRAGGDRRNGTAADRRGPQGFGRRGS